MKKITCIAFALLLLHNTHAQSTFRKIIGGPGADLARSVIQLPDGGYLVAGSTQLLPGAQDDALLIRLNKEGDILWQHTYGGSGTEVFTDCCVGNDGGYLCLGQTTSYGAGGLDVWFVKVDELGIVQWSNTYGSSTTDQSSFLVPLPPDSYITSTNTGNGDASQIDAYVLKINNIGQKQWGRSYSNGTDNLAMLWADPTSEKLWAAGIQQNSNGGFNGIIASINAATGVPLQLYNYGPGALYHNFPTPDGDLFAVDGSILPSTSERWAWALKINPVNGEARWSYLYGIPGHHYRSRAVPAHHNGFCLALLNVANNPVETTLDATIARIDSAGNILWAYDYGGKTADRLFDIQSTLDSGFVFCGAIAYQNPAEQDILLVKTDLDGHVYDCCLPETALNRIDFPVQPNFQNVPTLDWVNPVTQNLNAQNSTLDVEDLQCSDEVPFELVILQPACTEQQTGTIEVKTNCNNCWIVFQDSLSQTNIFSSLDTGTYKIAVYSPLGCQSDTTVILERNNEGLLAAMPNAFTPNGDALNERFLPAATPECPVKVRTLQIYDRWGKRVFEQYDFTTNAPNAGWDGMLDGKPAPADTYAFIVDYISSDGKSHQEHGNLTLLR